MLCFDLAAELSLSPRREGFAVIALVVLAVAILLCGLVEPEARIEIETTAVVPE